MTTEQQAVANVARRVGDALADLAARGVSSGQGPQSRALAALSSELGELGAHNLAASLRKLTSAVEARDAGAARLLLEAICHARVFERLVTLDAASTLLAGLDVP